MRIGFYIPSEQQRVGGLDLAIRSLQQALKRSGVDVVIDPSDLGGLHMVHFHGLWQRRFLSLARACRKYALPYIVSPHGMLEPWAWRHKWWKKWPYFFLLERAFLNSADGLLATSGLEKSHLENYQFRPPTTAIPLTLAEEVGPSYTKSRSILGWSDDEFVLLYLSRIHPKKGLHLLLEALTRLSPLSRPLRLIIIGDGERRYVATLHKFATEHRHQLPPVEFLGPKWGPEKWRYLQGADLFCLPTFSENFGLAILEACQTGTPVLTTSETPWGDFLERHGLKLAQPEVGSIARAMSFFLTNGKIDQESRDRLAATTRETFGWEQLSTKYSRYYHGVVQGERRIHSAPRHGSRLKEGTTQDS
ncbi:MAG TPA: glycosyltransferase [Chthoniobacterales bacterium]|nr:glycosyltransferase [Chthoniobacterales bacterium]